MNTQRSPSTGNTTALIVCTIVNFLIAFMGSSLNIALPAIGPEFGIDAIALSWIATIYLLTSAVFIVPFGRLADIHGRTRIFIFGIILYTVSLTLAGFSPSALWLIVFRGIQGIGAAMLFCTSMAIITAAYPPQQRGTALGISVAAVYIGLSLGPVLGGLSTQQFGWRSIFFFSAVIGIAATIVAVTKLKDEWVESKREKFDLAGSAFYGIALSLLIYGFTTLTSSTGIWLVLTGTAGLVFFVFWELRSKNPVLDMSLFKHNLVFSLSSVAALANYGATAGVSFLLSLYLQYMKGLSPAYAGLILIAQPIMQAALSPLAGRLSDKIEPGVVASTGMALITAGLILLIFINGETHLVYIITSSVILGIGFALFISPNTNAIMSSVEKRFYGIASSIVATMRIIGQMLSLGIITFLFTLQIGRAKITPEQYPLFMSSAKTAFLIFAIICFGGIFASLARGKTR